LRNDDMVISYSCFHFGPKYYRPTASDGHCHNRLLMLKLSALTANVERRRQLDQNKTLNLFTTAAAPTTLLLVIPGNQGWLW